MRPSVDMGPPSGRRAARRLVGAARACSLSLWRRAVYTKRLRQASGHVSAGASTVMDFLRLFGGLCGLTPRRRCRPGSGAARAESVFPAKREGSARGRRRHAVVVEALVPPSAARVTIRIATRVATVYTNAPKRRREAILANLCTLLRRRPGGDAHAVLAVTQPPTHTSSRSFHF